MAHENQTYPVVNLSALAAQLGVELDPALAALGQLYAQIDALNEENSRGLSLPCHRGCDACCHESVFLTPLEFFAVWRYVQESLSDAARAEIVHKGLSLYEEKRELIEALGEPPPPGHADHLAIAAKLRFTCPLLGADGACTVYPVRELYARMFGCSFNDAGGIYGCHLVGEHLGGREVRLLRVRSAARMLNELPLTFMRRPYPYYIHLLYGRERD